MKPSLTLKASGILNIVLTVALIAIGIIACKCKSGNSNKPQLITRESLPLTTNFDSALQGKGIYNMCDPIPPNIAKAFINAYEQDYPDMVKSLWIDSTTIRYYDSVLEVSKGNMDGIRIYLSEYTIPVVKPSDPNTVFQRGTQSIILVATQSVDSLVVAEGRHAKFHEDWYKGNPHPVHIRIPKAGNGDPIVDDYSDPCPPGTDCGLGNDLSNN